MFQQTIPTRLLVPRRETDFEGPRGPKWVRYSKEEEERLAQDCLYGEREARNTYVYIERPIERREQRPTFRSPPRSFLENRRPAGGKKYNGAENNQRLKIAKIEAGYGQRDVG